MSHSMHREGQPSSEFCHQAECSEALQLQGFFPLNRIFQQRQWGPGSRGPGSWHSHAQTFHGPKKPWAANAAEGFNFQDDGKGGLSLRGVAFMTVLAVLTGRAPCPPFARPTKNTVPRDDHNSFGGFGGCGGLGPDGYPP